MKMISNSLLIILMISCVTSISYGQNDTTLLNMKKQESNRIFRNVRWGMTREQVTQSESKASIEQLDYDALTCTIESGSSDYASLQVVYVFSETSDSLIAVMLHWKNATMALYDEVVSTLNAADGKSLFIDGHRYWLSQDRQTIHEAYLGTLIDDNGVSEDIYSASGASMFAKHHPPISPANFHEYIKVNPLGLNYAAYGSLQINMNYEDVCDVFGFEGREQSESELGGITTVIYQWQNKNGSNAIVTFQNDRLVAKAQSSLK